MVPASGYGTAASRWRSQSGVREAMSPIWSSDWWIQNIVNIVINTIFELVMFYLGVREGWKLAESSKPRSSSKPDPPRRSPS
jgi:hypothetical protein